MTSDIASTIRNFEMQPNLDWICKICFEVMTKEETKNHDCDEVHVDPKEIGWIDDEVDY